MEYPDRIESWRPVPGWPNYEISDLGRARSIGHMVQHRYSPYWRDGRILSQGGGGPYLHVRVYRPGESADLDVHVIELEAFAGPRPPGQVARHGRLGTRVNWWPENLCWGWQSDNLTVDRERDGTLVNGEQVYGAKLTAEIVAACRRRRAEGTAVMALAAEYGVSRSSMYRLLSGEHWRHIS